MRAGVAALFWLLAVVHALACVGLALAAWRHGNPWHALGAGAAGWFAVMEWRIALRCWRGE